MAVDYTPHTLVTFGGSLSEVASADEIWQCGVRGLTSGTGPIDPSQFEAYAAAVETPLIDWFSATDSYVPSSVVLDWIKVANIGADGKYTSDSYTLSFAGVEGSSGSPAAPSFTCVALSWTTATRTGLATKGRVYPPNFAAPLHPGGYATITAAAQTALVASGQTLLSALNQDASEYSFYPHVMSTKDGAHNLITGVRVGNVYDVQRRRKNAVRETYTAGTWP